MSLSEPMAQKLVANTTPPNRQPIASPPSASQTAPCCATVSRSASIICRVHFAREVSERHLSPRGRGREAMTYGRAFRQDHKHPLDGAAVSHLAELVRGDLFCASEGPLIRPSGTFSPRGEGDLTAAAG